MDKVFLRSYSRPLYSFEDLSGLVIVLGRGCNMNCPHCGDNHNKSCLDISVTSEFIDWIAKWVEYGIKYNKGKKSILFWGGEPLVYLDKIKYIVESLKSRGYQNNIYYKIFTNGLLLTENVMCYLGENSFEITLSYDAPEPLKIRSDVPDDEIIKRFNAYSGGKKFVQAVYNAEVTLVDIYKGLADKFPGVARKVGFMRSGAGVPKRLSIFPVGKVREDYIELYKYWVETGYPSDIADFKGVYKKYVLFSKVGSSEYIEYPFPYCEMHLSALPIDLAGNVYVCHNADFLVGNIFNEDYNSLQDKFMDMLRINRPDSCKKCVYIGICPNGCPVYEKDDLGNLTQCRCFKERNDTIVDIIYYGKYI